MKLLLLTAFVATVCYVNAGKTQRMLAAMANAGLLGGMNGGLAGLNGGLAGLNGGMAGLNGGMAGLNGGMAGLNGGMAGLNGGMANGVIPGMMAGGLNPPIVARGGAGLFGQPQFAQLVPGLPAFALPAPVPNVYPVPVVNAVPVMGVPQMSPMSPPQQPLVAGTGGTMQQQVPPQTDPLRRFRRHIMQQDNTFKTTVDTQIPLPTETMTTTPLDKEGHPQDN